jgi:6-phosphogluconate dehydrogenase (decarboxylating)
MQFAITGFGPIGARMVRRPLNNDNGRVVHNRQPAEVAKLQADDADGAASPAELVSKMTRPRAIWLLVPAGAVDQALAKLVPHLEAGDTVIDGGNSYYRDDNRRAKELAAAGLDGALLLEPQVADYGGRVSDFGEGRWTLQASIDEAVPAELPSTAPCQRFASRDEAGFTNEVLSALRHQFSGHAEKPTRDST